MRYSGNKPVIARFAGEKPILRRYAGSKLVWEATPSDPSLLLHLKFDGNVSDSSQYKNEVTLVRPENTSYVTGVEGQAVKLFNGQAGNVNKSYLTFPNEGALAEIDTAFTVAFYLKAPAGSGLNPYILMNTSDTTSGFRIYPGSSDGKLQVWLFKENGTSEILRTGANARFNSSEFNHFAITYDGEALTWYYNFEPDTTADVELVDITGTADWRINSAATFVASQDITLDDFRIYNRALAAEEIERLAH